MSDLGRAAGAPFRALAEYNRRANNALAEILTANERIAAQSGTTWFGSILETLDHVVAADTIWLHRVPGGASYVPEPFRRRPAVLGETLSDTVAGWYALRAPLDVSLERYCATITADRLAAEVRYTNSRGVVYRQPLHEVLLHVFNHQTHHRAQITVALDAAGIDNDVSNLAWYFRTPDETVDGPTAT